MSSSKPSSAADDAKCYTCTGITVFNEERARHGKHPICIGLIGETKRALSKEELDKMHKLAKPREIGAGGLYVGYSWWSGHMARTGRAPLLRGKGLEVQTGIKTTSGPEQQFKKFNDGLDDEDETMRGLSQQPNSNMRSVTTTKTITFRIGGSKSSSKAKNEESEEIAVSEENKDKAKRRYTVREILERAKDDPEAVQRSVKSLERDMEASKKRIEKGQKDIEEVKKEFIAGFGNYAEFVEKNWKRLFNDIPGKVRFAKDILKDGVEALPRTLTGLQAGAIKSAENMRHIIDEQIRRRS